MPDPTKQIPDYDAKLTLIEAMLDKGMGEDEIRAAFAPPRVPFEQGVQQAFGKAESIGPAHRDPENRLLSFAKRFMGIADPGMMTPDEERGTLPLPFTENRLKPADAAMGAMGVASGVNFARALPSFARNLLSEASAGPASAIPNPISQMLARPTPPPTSPSSPLVTQMLAKARPASPNPVENLIGRLMPEAPPAPSPFLQPEEAGSAAAQLGLRFGEAAPKPPLPRLVPPNGGRPVVGPPSYNDQMLQIIQNLYKQ